MNILVPAALAFSAIIPIILLLYFMRPKRQERVIGSTLLWQQALQDLQASRPWQRLRITPLLLLQLLAAIFIVLVLARPAIFTSSPVSGNTIVILQASASMQATDVAPDRFENAKNTITDMIDALGTNDYLSLITMARTPQVLATHTQDKTLLRNELQHARVTNQDADLVQALSLATSLAAGQAHAQVIVVGDGHVMTNDQALATPFPVRYLTVGTDAPNVALMALSARQIQSRLVALAQVANYSHEQRAISVELQADNKVVAVKTINLPAGASGSLQWDPIPANTRILKAHLNSQDAMTVDHDAWAIVGGSLRGRTLLVTKGNRFLETALRLQPNVDLYEVTPDKYNGALAYDLTIFDGFVPATLPTGNLFFLNPPKGSYSFGGVADDTTVSHISPGNDTLNLLADVDLGTIHVIHASHVLKPALWAQTVINAPETPLLLAGENSNRRSVVLGFDLHDSDLPLQPAFPLLIHNLTNWLLPPPVGGDGQVLAGNPVTIQTWPGADRVTITNPEQQTTTVGPPFPTNPYTATNTVGLYQVTQHVRNQTLNGAFTVNLFNATQSHLAPAKALPVLHSTTVTGAGNGISRQLREIWPWIAAILLLILCAEWWLFSRTYRQAQGAQRHGPTISTRAGKKTRTQLWLTTLQEQAQARYTTLKKRTVKATRRVRGRLRKPGKGQSRVNI